MAGLKTFAGSRAILALLSAIMLTAVPFTSQAVPAGTAISNTATVIYNTGMATGLTKTSNTHIFTVDELNLLGKLTYTASETKRVYGGSTIELITEVNNIGQINYTTASLTYKVPTGSQLNMITAGTSLASVQQTESHTLYTINIPAQTAGSLNSYRASLKLPMDITNLSGNTSVTLAANGTADLDIATLALTLKNRTEARVDLMNHSTNPDHALISIPNAEYRDATGTYRTLAVPHIPDTATLITDEQIRLLTQDKFSHKQTIFVRVTDDDHNHDSTAIETVDATFIIAELNEKEVVRLYETSANSGVFIAYLTQSLNPAIQYDGLLNVGTDVRLEVTYRDDVDASDAETTIAIVDPFGIIFDSATGAPLDGYTVHMIDADTGMPAYVVGDDGVSRYPSTVITGGVVSDASGRVYEFDKGAYRFPFAPVGHYKLVVVPPEDAMYTLPSTREDALLQQLPGAPFALKLGSRGETFPLVAGPPLEIDIPVDPLSKQMHVRRSANKEKIAAGDFIQFRVEIESIANADLINVLLHDVLPRGLRYMEGSTFINGRGAADPAIDNTGTGLTFQAGTLAQTGTLVVEYVASAGAINTSTITSTSYATANSGLADSNTAKLQTMITDDLMRSRALILGEIKLDEVTDKDQHPDLSGIRIYMEDGRYAVTDKRGMYHFDDIKPGNHVLQIDTTTLPAHHEVIVGEENSRFAGSAESQFIDVQGGTLWRSDFYIRKVQAPQGEFTLHINTPEQANSGVITYHVGFETTKIAVDNVRITAVLPESAIYKEGSSTLNGIAVKDPSVVDNMLIFRLGNIDANTENSLSFSTGGINDTDITTKAFAVMDTPAKRNLRSAVANHELKKPATSALAATFGEPIKVSTQGLDPSAIGKTTEKQKDLSVAKKYDAEWLSQQTTDIRWLVPEGNYLPKQASTDILIKHEKSQNVSVLINGVAVHAANYNGRITSQGSDAIITSWTGVDMTIGDSLLEAIITDTDGKIVKRLKRILHVSGSPADAYIVKDKSTIIADGRTPPVLALRVLDKDGFPIREGMGGQIRVRPPYKIADNNDFSIDNMAGNAEQLHTYVVTDDGIAYIKLEPTNNSDVVTLEYFVEYGEKREASIKLVPEKRDWILVGLGEHTIAQSKIEEHMDTQGISSADDIHQDGRVAFYAKGRVTGDWLLTLAYDSAKERSSVTDPQMFQAIDPGTYYTVYGDNSNSGFDATSSEKLYLKLERDEFFFLFGDYETKLTDTQLAVYNRTFTGIKTQYIGEKLEVVTFAANTNQSFIRDEIRANGTSGPYQLSRNNVAMNSEKVTIQVRDRFRSEVIIDTREMLRHTDYDIDYERGTITFKRPVFSVDQALNHKFIVVHYEAYDNRDEQLTYGARVKADLTENTTIGLTHVDEGRTGGNSTLSGGDLRVQLTENIEVYAETAKTEDTINNIQTNSGSAHLAQVEYKDDLTQATAYRREQEPGFGLGQTNGSENGSIKTGVDASRRLTKHITLSGESYTQENTVTNAERVLTEASSQFNLGNTSLNLGLRSVTDTRGNGQEQVSEQLTTGASQSLPDGRTSIHVGNEYNLNRNEINSVDFPNRTTWGIDYKLTPETALFLEEEYTNGDQRDTRSTVIGLKSTPWWGSDVYTGLTRKQDGVGETTSANVGLTQQWKLTETWSIDVGAEEQKTLSSQGYAQFNNNVPYASGNSNDFTTLSFGATYAPGSWMWTGRVENRDAELDQQRTLSTSIESTPNQKLSTLASVSTATNERITGEQNIYHDLTLGLAYRPRASRWILLDKLSIKYDETSNSEFNSESWRGINLLHANYKPEDRWQLSLQYGAKTIKERINNIDYKSFVDLMGIEARYDITKTYDIGVHGNILHAWDLKQYDYNTGVSVGMAAAKNLWISVGYNFKGFRDEDFSRSNHTAEGVFVKFRFKFDQRTVKEGLEWLKK